MPQKQNPVSIKKIEVGEFHIIHDGSKNGHPGYVIWKDQNGNLYLLVKIGSSPNKNNVQLQNKLSTNVKSHYYYKKPILAKRKDIGSSPLLFLTLTDEFLKIVENLRGVEPNETKSIKRKDRYYFKKANKKPSEDGVPLVKGNCPTNKGPA